MTSQPDETDVKSRYTGGCHCGRVRLVGKKWEHAMEGKLSWR